MADNVVVTPGSGKTVLADEVIDGTLGTGIAQFIKIMDGTIDGTAKVAVKAASTAPVATDPALVVGISPNSVNPNGQANMAGSAPVVIASNQAGYPIFPSPTTSGGCSMFSAIMANSTNATNVKASAGQLYKIEAFNNSATVAYLKLYDSATAPTAGSGTPKKRIMIPANGGVEASYDNGDAFTAGIGFTTTGAIGDADTTAVAASTFLVNMSYK
jgi:hypothetical protein